MPTHGYACLSVQKHMATHAYTWLHCKVLRWFGGPEGCTKQLRSACARPVQVHILQATGHWVQQERPGRVSHLLLEFLATHQQLFAPPSGRADRAGPRSHSKL